MNWCAFVPVRPARSRHDQEVTRAAPRISPRLVDAIDRLDDPRVPIAETARRVCAEAERLGLLRPSYQQIRVLVHELRALRPKVTTRQALVEVWLRARPVTDLYGLDDGTIRPLR
jgi:hypothetical protein